MKTPHNPLDPLAPPVDHRDIVSLRRMIAEQADRIDMLERVIAQHISDETEWHERRVAERRQHEQSLLLTRIADTVAREDLG